jgi:ribonuclease-3
MGRGPKPKIEELEASLGHTFRDRDLLKQALTHVSAVSGGKRHETYQRLEFLGDRVLGLSVSQILFEMFPKAEEGELSRRLADLVRKETCADVARAWSVGPHLRLGLGESQTGGRDKTAILGDACEALIGAVFVDAGYEAARDLVRRGFSDRMKAPRHSLRDAKTSLQEWAQARGLEPPSYKEASRSGPAHAPQFTIAVEVQGFEACSAEGASKRFAEQAAAEAFMAREGIVPGRSDAKVEASA